MNVDAAQSPRLLHPSWVVVRCWLVVVTVLVFAWTGCGQTSSPELPNAPSTSRQISTQAQVARRQARAARRHSLLPCPDSSSPLPITAITKLQGPPPCQEENPIQSVVTSPHVKPLTSKEKGLLALRDYFDPFNFLTIATYSGGAIAANAHSAYGPGLKGFGRLTGYSMAVDGQGEFFETYALSSLLHEDPRYHRMPNATFKRRVWHAIEHTYVSQHDDGRRMPNYATLLTYPISAEISNLYVPGVQTDLPSTGKRVALGIASYPAGSLIAEFLPDVARHVHIHIVFAQEILNRMVAGAPSAQ